MIIAVGYHLPVCKDTSTFSGQSLTPQTPADPSGQYNLTPFNVLSPLGYAILRHRLGQQTFFVGLWETIKWAPFFLLFFGGVSYHLLKAICCHFLSINIEWTTTAKELEASGFRIGLDRIVRDFKWMYVLMLSLAGGMIYLGCSASYSWYITDFSAIVPLANQVGCHALLPFALGLF